MPPWIKRVVFPKNLLDSEIYASSLVARTFAEYETPKLMIFDFADFLSDPFIHLVSAIGG